jgi:hypothetical protein
MSMVPGLSWITKFIEPRERPLLETRGLSRKFLLEYFLANSPYLVVVTVGLFLLDGLPLQSSSALFSSGGSCPGSLSEKLAPWRARMDPLDYCFPLGFI